MIWGSKYDGVEEKYINDFSDAMFLRDTLMSCNIKYAGQMIGSFESVTKETLKFLISSKAESGGSYKDIGDYVFNSVINVFLDDDICKLPMSAGVDGVLMLCVMFEEVIYDLYTEAYSSNDSKYSVYMDAVEYLFRDVSNKNIDGLVVASLINYSCSSVISQLYPSNVVAKLNSDLKDFCKSYTPSNAGMNRSVFDVGAFVDYFKTIEMFN